MQPRTRKNLADALSASQKPLDLVGEQPEMIRSDEVKGLAAERLFMITGEALARVRSEDPSMFKRIRDGQAIVGLRNLLVHGYDRIDVNVLVDALREDVPVLVTELQELL